MVTKWLASMAIGLAWVSACSAGGASRSSGSTSGAATNGASAGGGLQATSGAGGGEPIVEDPATCEEAAASKSYVGCDFWPTVVDNIVSSYFDFAVVVANAGNQPADVTVTRAGSTIATATVAPSSLETIYLPWVDELKSPSLTSFCAPSSIKTETVRAPGGAYHLTTTMPVTVYQFNAIEYAAVGGPPGKDWSSCQASCSILGCFSYTNDASLLLPTTALTGTYRIGGWPSWTDPDGGFTYPPYFAVTGTQDGTQVDVKLGPNGGIAGGGGVASAPPGGSVAFTLDRGDVVQVVGASPSDLSGSLVKASAPVQVITGIACTNNPTGTEACDHLEESVLPAETLGQRYFVTVPTGPQGQPVGHVVRIYGNVDGTSLDYPGDHPGGPASIDAGETADLGIVSLDFEIVADQAIAVASFQLGADLLMPGVPQDQQLGDPAQSFMVAVEQYRSKYVFLAPSDYVVSYVDVVQPLDATLSLDGTPLAVQPVPLGSGFGLARVALPPGGDGAHVLSASAPVGIQVAGYGSYTSYQYAGGLNLGHIAPPPPK